MGLIDYTSLEDGTPVTANIFNERFGQIIAVINGGLDQNNFAAGGIPKAALASEVYEQMYPVGSLYFNATDNTNPSEILTFGTWVAFGAGRVPVGYDATDTDFNAAEKTSGAKTHTLTVTEIPAHKHSLRGYGATLAQGSFGWRFGGSGTIDSSDLVSNTGGGKAHNNVQPSIAVYIWKRTA